MGDILQAKEPVAIHDKLPVNHMIRRVRPEKVALSEQCLGRIDGIPGLVHNRVTVHK